MYLRVYFIYENIQINDIHKSTYINICPFWYHIQQILLSHHLLKIKIRRSNNSLGNIKKILSILTDIKPKGQLWINSSFLLLYFCTWLIILGRITSSFCNSRLSFIQPHWDWYILQRWIQNPVFDHQLYFYSNYKWMQ